METAARTNEAKYDCLLFDMDETLYPRSCGFNLASYKNIQDFMLDCLQIEEGQVQKLCLDLYREHGTTLAGLKALGYEFDDDEFHAYAHGRLPYEALQPDPFLRSLLLSMPHRKLIFTNADKAHAAKVISRLGLEDCFEGVICFETLNRPPNQVHHQLLDFGEPDHSNPKATDCRNNRKVVCKPSLKAFQAVIRIASIDPKKTIFFYDSASNIAAAKAAGFHTVLVGSSLGVEGADVALESIHSMREALPQLWQ